MQVELPRAGLQAYSSHSQRARITTEAWGLKNLYCANCDASALSAARTGLPTVDYTCEECGAAFQLKSQARRFAGRIVDSAYGTMVAAMKANRTPNLFAMHYDPIEWRVENLILIPHFAFPLSAIEKRKPLSPTARRAGWVGCNILLGAIPVDARIKVVMNGRPVATKLVRAQYERIRPLEKINFERRGWTIDVLNVVRSLNKTTFSLSEMYERDAELAMLHPENRHVRDKIRQQLQILRDLRLLEFHGGGTYRLT